MPRLTEATLSSFGPVHSSAHVSRVTLPEGSLRTMARPWSGMDRTDGRSDGQGVVHCYGIPHPPYRFPRIVQASAFENMTPD